MAWFGALLLLLRRKNRAEPSITGKTRQETTQAASWEGEDPVSETTLARAVEKVTGSAIPNLRAIGWGEPPAGALTTVSCPMWVPPRRNIPFSLNSPR